MIWKNKATRRITEVLKQGITPEKLALSLSLGITVGIIPLYGFTSLIVTLIALVFRLNFALTHAVHYIVHPLQIALIIPFMKLGEIFYDGTLIPNSIKNFMFMVNNDLWGTLHNFWVAYLSAFLIWLIISIPLVLILYRSLIRPIRRYKLAILR
jgi:uncharacterized protein (DUF2062 family)